MLRIPLFCLLSLLLFSSCGGEPICTGDNGARYQPDLSGTPAPKLALVRFDQILRSIDTANLQAETEKIKAAHAEFAPLFLRSIIAPAQSGEDSESLREFLQFPDTRLLLDTIQQVFADFSPYQKQIESVLQLRQYYFPADTQRIDTLYTFASLYNYGYGTFENHLVVGLDYFLGEQHFIYSLIPNLSPQYIRRTLTPAHLTRSVAYALASDLVERNAKRSGNKMIDYMLYEGKKLYLTSMLLPAAPDSIVFGFSRAQMEHCVCGERGLYDHLVKEKLFYSDKFNDFRKYVELGPFNPSNGLYGNSASWLGCRMIEQYVEAERRQKPAGAPNDANTMQKMLRDDNVQAFFKRYKPRQ